jgi:hypothetical protein
MHRFNRCARRWLRGLEVLEGLLRVIFVKFYEIAEGDRKFHVLIGVEGIEAERVFKPGNDQRETEGIEAGFQKLQIIRETRQLALLFNRNLLELLGNRRSERHEWTPARMVKIRV